MKNGYFLRNRKRHLNEIIARNKLIFVYPILCISNLNAIYCFYFCKEIWERKIDKLGFSCGKLKIKCLSRCGWKPEFKLLFFCHLFLFLLPQFSYLQFLVSSTSFSFSIIRFASLQIQPKSMWIRH